MSERTKRRRGLGLRGALILAAAAAIAAVAALSLCGLIRWPWQNSGSHGAPVTLPAASSGIDLTPDPTLGWNAVDFQNAVLGQTREQSELAVMEQDVTVDTAVTSALANLDVFRKTKTIHSSGTGVYTTDLAGVDSGCVTVDAEAGTVTVAVPNTTLRYVTVDLDKTTFEETQHALLAFGDLKLTAEQQQALSGSIEDAMRQKLDTPELLRRADEAAVKKLTALFQPVVSGVSDRFTVVIVFRSAAE